MLASLPLASLPLALALLSTQARADDPAEPPDHLVLAIDFDVPVRMITLSQDDLRRGSPVHPLRTALRRTPGVLVDHDRVFINGTPVTTGNLSLDGIVLLAL